MATILPILPNDIWWIIMAKNKCYLPLTQGMIKNHHVYFQHLTPEALYRAFMSACAAGKIEMVEMFIRGYNVDPTWCNNSALLEAIGHNRLDVVKYLTGLSGVNPAAHGNLAIRTAGFHGHTNIVKYLATYPNVYLSSICIVHASACGYLEIVKTLVDKSCTTSFDINEALIGACDAGKLDVVKFLVTQSTINPTVYDNLPIKNAVRKGHTEIINFLLTLPGVHL
jgi:ankyrin repeat protein